MRQSKEKLPEELSLITVRKPDNITELSIRLLLPEHKRYNSKHTFNYKVSGRGIEFFSNEIESFISIYKKGGA